jgi:hypothetical protein
MILSPQRRMPRRIALGVVLVVLSAFLAATAATASASSSAPATPVDSSRLSTLAQVSLAPSRTAGLAEAPEANSMASTSYRRPAPAVRPRTATARAKSARRSTRYISSARSASSVRKTSTRTVSRTTATRKPSAGELARAKAILAGYIAKYPICKGATIYIAMVPALQGGAQGCVFLGSGTIVINPNHTADLSWIIGHEINHLRDYRERHP